MAMMTTDGNPAVGTYDAPCLHNSDIPGIFGLKSLEENGAVLDIAQNKLYLLGEGDYDLMSCFPPGTKCFELQRSATGHLVLPSGRYKDVEAAQELILKRMNAVAQDESSADDEELHTTGVASNQSQSSSSGLQIQGATEYQVRETERLIAEMQSVCPSDLGIASQIAECAQFLVDNQQQIDSNPTVNKKQLESIPLESIPEHSDSGHRAEERKPTKSQAYPRRSQRGKNVETRRLDAFNAWGVSPPQPVQTEAAQSQDGLDPSEKCQYCHRPTTDSRGVQTVMWTTMLVSRRDDSDSLLQHRMFNQPMWR